MTLMFTMDGKHAWRIRNSGMVVGEIVQPKEQNSPTCTAIEWRLSRSSFPAR